MFTQTQRAPAFFFVGYLLGVNNARADDESISMQEVESS